MTARGERGLALVSVLWGVAILSLIAAAMLAASVSSSQIGRNVWSATQAGAVADAAVGRAVLSLMDDRMGKQPRVDGKLAVIAVDGVPVRLWIQDESGKINLNYADKSLLQSLFVSAGVAEGEAGALADRIVARRIGPNGAALFAYRAVDDVLGVPGMTPALFRRVAPALTVFGRNGAPNQSVAPREVLRVLPGMTDDAIADILKARDAAPAATGAAAPQSVYLVTAETRTAGARIVRTAVVTFTGDTTKPYLILAWR